MVDERPDTREATLRQRWPWLELFRGFQVAIDFRKLLLAAAGIIAMALGWWVLANIFNYSEPQWPGAYKSHNPDDNEAWNEFKVDRRKWNIMHQAADDPADRKRYDASDVANNLAQYLQISKAAEQDYGDAGRAQEAWSLGDRQPHLMEALSKVPGAVEAYGRLKPVGQLRTLPWSEPRGDNPYLVVTSQEGRGFFQTLGLQIPVLLEPLAKFLRPIVLMLEPGAGPLARLYFFLVILWTLAVWALIGGAITRMAAVEVARREKIGMVEAVRFALQRFLSLFSAPLFPLLFVAIIVVLVILFGFIQMIPLFGDIVMDGLLWPLILVAGLVMAVVLVGLVGWPLMSATISAEGTDSWEAVSRSYSYVFQAPWHYLWYSLVALAYGAVLIFFVSLMGSMTAYLGKWALLQTPFLTSANREPYFLFVYSPTSYQWRTLLVDGAKVKDTNGAEHYLVTNGELNDTAYQLYVNGTATTPRNEVLTADSSSHMTWYNRVGAWLVTLWLGLLFLLVIGFGYSYFWSAATIIYLLMRHKVDDADLDEVYLEEEDQDEFYKDVPKPEPRAPAPTPSPAPAATGAPVTMVEPPTLRVNTPSSASPPVMPLPTVHPMPPTPPVPPPSATSESPPPATEDGNPPLLP